MTEFVKLTARQDDPLRLLEMHAPLEQAEAALRSLAEQLPPTFTFSAKPVPEIGLRSESAPA